MTSVCNHTLLSKLRDALIKKWRGLITKDVRLFGGYASSQSFRGAVEESKLKNRISQAMRFCSLCNGALSRLLTNPLGESLGPEWHYFNPTFSRRNHDMQISE
ncbi:hypothetical protein TNCV_523361 [Trichonephila clavipes]|nr:hypothetical protein TNCV_523361 [Trichonephila clavipes]